MRFKDVNLLTDPPARALGKLSLPIMATSFVQMAYSLTDMFWIGWLGAFAVAAVGSAGMFMWFSEGFALIPRMGGQVLSGQALGAGDLERARRSARNALQVGLLLALIITALLFVGRRPLIAVFGLNEQATISAAELYLSIVALGIIPSFLVRILTGLLTAAGNSHTPFRVTVVGLVLNMLLDPLFIFAFKMGVAGAALATVLAQLVVCLLFIRAIGKHELFRDLRFFERGTRADYGKMLRIGLPSGLQTMLYSSVSMLLSRLVARFGDAAVGVVRVGGQIESLAWMTADGLSASINAFTAQNFGAGNAQRLRRGYNMALLFSLLIGLGSTALLFIFPAEIMSLFFHEPAAIATGAGYLYVMAFSQIFMVLEIMTTGAFSGYGLTIIPSTVITVLTVLRLPLAYFLSRSSLGLHGIWWAISATSIAKGIVLCTWFILFQKKKLGRMETIGPVTLIRLEEEN